MSVCDQEEAKRPEPEPFASAPLVPFHFHSSAENPPLSRDLRKREMERRSEIPGPLWLWVIIIGLIVVFCFWTAVFDYRILDRLQSRRVSATEFNLSLVPPPGWEIVDGVPNALVFRGPTDRGFAPVLSVRADPYSGRPPIEAFAGRIRPNLVGGFSQIRDGFTEIDGKKAYFVHVNSMVMETELANIQYFCPSDRTMYSITCTVAADVYHRYASVFDDVIKSIHVE
jgi:hypothetical protein